MSCKCWLYTVCMCDINREVQSIVFVLNKTGPGLKSWVAQLYPTPSSPAGVVRVITLPPSLYSLIFPTSLSPSSWAFFTSLHLASRIDVLRVLSHIPFLTTWAKRKSEWETTLRPIPHWRRGSPKAPTTGQNCRLESISQTCRALTESFFLFFFLRKIINLSLFCCSSWNEHDIK